MYKVGDLVSLTEAGSHYWDGLSEIKRAWTTPEYFIIEEKTRLNWDPVYSQVNGPCVNAYCSVTDKWYSFFLKETAGFADIFKHHTPLFEEEWVDCKISVAFSGDCGSI